MENGPIKRFQLGDLCERLNVRPRDARYVLEQGYVPEGVERAPESGNYRQFKPDQAFWLGMVLKLKAVGVKTPLAAQVADYAQNALRGIAQSACWDYLFSPRAGQFDTEHQYYVDVGDLKWIRFATNANPSGGGNLEEFPWTDLGRHLVSPPPIPCVILRLNLTEIARLLGGHKREKS